MKAKCESVTISSNFFIWFDVILGCLMWEGEKQQDMNMKECSIEYGYFL